MRCTINFIKRDPTFLYLLKMQFEKAYSYLLNLIYSAIKVVWWQD